MPTPTPAWRPESRLLPKQSGTTSIDRAYWHSSWRSSTSRMIDRSGTLDTLSTPHHLQSPS
eukprot:scaffold39458_cov34-Cyclotella_meneghiniana.AAC.2